MVSLKNDDKEGMEEHVIQGLRDVGAFGIMSPEKYGLLMSYIFSNVHLLLFLINN